MEMTDVYDHIEICRLVEVTDVKVESRTAVQNDSQTHYHGGGKNYG